MTFDDYLFWGLFTVFVLNELVVRHDLRKRDEIIKSQRSVIDKQRALLSLEALRATPEFIDKAIAVIREQLNEEDRPK